MAPRAECRWSRPQRATRSPRGKLVLAEFDYQGRPQETFPFDPSKERYSMYRLKMHGLPLLHWQRGRRAEPAPNPAN